MRGEIVALDLETTGLNHYEDDIIEIGAALFREGEVIEEFGTLINPGRHVPERVTAITGIRPDELAHAPRIEAVLPTLRRFIGSRPLVGHNVEFDLGFLARYNLGRNHVVLDTYELASVVLPTTPRYTLTHLAGQFGLNLEHAHRALDDARATGWLYWTLWQHVLKLPLATIQEIVEAARGLDWSAESIFSAALHERSHTALVEAPADDAPPDWLSGDGLFRPASTSWYTLEPNDVTAPLDVDRLAGLIETERHIARTFPGYEHRPQQVDMLRAVATAFNRGDHLLVEAPTGVGKSLAYLLPAVTWATQNNERVVVSTATINLQEQLFTKDLPRLAAALGLPFQAAIVKGRDNYLCPRRLLTLRRRRPTSIAELRVLAKILVWLLQSSTGDKGEISLRGPEEYAIWTRLSAADEGCTLERCAEQMHGACPFFKARRDAEAAHIVIVNHALLLADVQVGSHALPEYHRLIIDEAHQLEEATTNGLAYQLSQAALLRQLDDLGTPRTGLLGDVIRSTRGSVPGQYFKSLEAYVQTVADTVKLMGVHVEQYFATLYRALENADALREGEYVNQVRITPDLRHQPGWEQVEMAWDVLSKFTEAIAGAMNQVARGLSRLDQFDVPNFEDLLSSVQAAARHLDQVHRQLGAFSSTPQDNTIYWVQVGQERERLSIHAAPLNVGPLLDQHLWQTKKTVILTSATLRTAGTFDYMRDRLSTENMTNLVVGTPFDYKSSTLLYIPTDMPAPENHEHYQRQIARTLVELAKATNGRLLGLFTSYTQLRQTAQAIAPQLALDHITVFDQSDGTSRQSLLDGFKQTERAVLLGTRSFWEGVDIPGDDLSVLVIVRLPFAVPTDPIFAARSEQYENSFMQYAVPDAALRFRQGFGRLIRTRQDRGIVVLLDNRVITKRYGQAFLDSLPDCTVRRGLLADLPRAAAGWLALPRQG